MKITITQTKNRTMIQNNYALHEQSFLAYIEQFFQGTAEPCLTLKKQHTFRVVQNTESILEHLPLSEENRYCARLIALYHDIGRFCQYQKYHTFLDKKSEDHASIAVRILKKQAQFLQEPKHIQKKILSAIMLHNKLALPHGLPSEYKDLCQIIRDADKLDIIRVMAENFTHDLPEKEGVTLSAKDEPLCYSNHILEQAMHKQASSYLDIVYVNDFKILICGWIFSLYYKDSIKILQRQGNIQTILATLPKTKEIEGFNAFIMKSLNAE